jgi:hypothetical protein
MELVCPAGNLASLKAAVDIPKTSPQYPRAADEMWPELGIG